MSMITKAASGFWQISVCNFALRAFHHVSSIKESADKLKKK